MSDGPTGDAVVSTLQIRVPSDTGRTAHEFTAVNGDHVKKFRPSAAMRGGSWSPTDSPGGDGGT